MTLYRPPGWCERWRHVKWWHEVAVSSDPLTASHAHTGWPPVAPRQAGRPASALATCLLSQRPCGAHGVATLAQVSHGSETAWSIWLPVQVDGLLLGHCLWLWRHSIMGQAHPGSAVTVRHRKSENQAKQIKRYKMDKPPHSEARWGEEGRLWIHACSSDLLH